MLFKSIDQYCERIDPTFWSEPINAFSNLAFILAGLYGFIQYTKLPVKSSWPLVFSILCTSIGIGSFLFHTFANGITMIADVVPILVYIIVFSFYILKELLVFSWKKILLINAIFLVASVLSKGTFLNGSITYIPTLALLLYLTLQFKLKGSAFKFDLNRLFIVFFINLIFRSSDMAICGVFPIGTHFIWHMGNGLLLFFTLQLCMKAEAKRVYL